MSSDIVKVGLQYNSEAMQHALSDIIDIIDEWRTDGSMEHWQYSQLFDIADAALAALPRNCDVGTADEQYERWQTFCDRYDDDCTGCPCDNKHTYTLTSCFARWSQMPYESEVSDGK